MVRRATAIDCLNGNLIQALYRARLGPRRARAGGGRELLRLRSRGSTSNALRMRSFRAHGAPSKALLGLRRRSLGGPDGRGQGSDGGDGANSCSAATSPSPTIPAASGSARPGRSSASRLSYSTNVLEALHVLAELGYGARPSLKDAIRLVLSKQDWQGRWKMEIEPERQDVGGHRGQGASPASG